MIGKANERFARSCAMRAAACDQQWPTTFRERRGRGIDRRRPCRLRRARGIGNDARVGRRHVDRARLHVHRKEQRNRPFPRGGSRLRQGSPCGARIRRHERAQSGRSQHADRIERLGIGTVRIRRRGCYRWIAEDQQHARSAAQRVRGAVQCVGSRGSAAEDRDPDVAGGRGVTLRHRDGVVLVPRRVEAHAHRVERGDEERRIVAHEAEHARSAGALEVRRQRFVRGNGGRHRSIRTSRARSSRSGCDALRPARRRGAACAPWHRPRRRRRRCWCRRRRTTGSPSRSPCTPCWAPRP